MRGKDSIDFLLDNTRGKRILLGRRRKKEYLSSMHCQKGESGSRLALPYQEGCTICAGAGKKFMFKRRKAPQSSVSSSFLCRRIQYKRAHLTTGKGI